MKFGFSHSEIKVYKNPIPGRLIWFLNCVVATDTTTCKTLALGAWYLIHITFDSTDTCSN